jgi:hypothetical protein
MVLETRWRGTPLGDNRLEASVSSEKPDHEPEPDLPDDEDDDLEVGDEPELDDDEAERALGGDPDPGPVL